MKVLLLGGTADGRRMADALHQAGVRVVYSLAGLVRVPKVDCELVVGGFTQFGGLSQYIKDHQITLILDVTHPYAQTMSGKAVAAARASGIPCWRFHRPAWQPVTGDDWRYYDDDTQLLSALKEFHTPLLSAGQVSEPLLRMILKNDNLTSVIWRTAVAAKFALPERVQWIKAIGPFALEDERELLLGHNVDVIVSKNSGGLATYAKLEAARELGIPVLLHERPELAVADEEFSDTKACLQACLSACGVSNLGQKDNQQ
ncbi:precorrin-6A/cobalt-precorrin-6A reductase [Marinomonas pollencensis]|uniref:Precorrin-6A/cobalt-precorrin-6A reductase n=1 Tax=Marinomonas pollencensis TaxID=491954 RepID=A0A3E0DL02_9GAMM|nr:precorrin-6A/cobalt-precorrin-6A reductase [Marinomonas pollencensis]REG82216.1 precorrin-6A/cobalt-precorrin-6A reductase [Marinomonas pollencensis]